MNKKLIGLSLLAFTISLVSCSKNENEIEIPNEEPTPGLEGDMVDLSKDEMANCYIVQSPGKYKFKADNQFNLGEGLPVPPAIEPQEAGLIWQTTNGSIKAVELISENNEPYVAFEVENAEGNALIAVYDSRGRVAWSWHIWMPIEEISSMKTATGYEVMNMNLGAMNNTPGSAESYGMLYQWGRKDPFPAASTLTGTTATISADMYDITGKKVVINNSSWYDTIDNTIEYSISHPTTCLSNYAQYANSRDWLREELSDPSLWGNPEGDKRNNLTDTYPNKGVKTCYDPSPAGWRVAPPDVFRNFTTSGGYAWTLNEFNVYDLNSDGIISLDDYLYGWHFLIDNETPLYFPAAARFDGSYAMLMGSVSGLWGNYWSNSPYSSMNGGAFCALAFQVKDQNGNDMVTISPSAASSRADAFSIRCIKD